MHTMLRILIACCILLAAAADQIVPNLQKYSTVDPNFNSTALIYARKTLQNLIKGNRLYLVPILDPLTLRDYTVNNGRLIVLCRNVRAIGLANLNLTITGLDVYNKNINLEGRVPELNLSGNYDIKGILVGHRISGNGKFVLSFNDTVVKYSTNYRLHTHDDGKVYLVPKDYHLRLEPENMIVELGNLFNGNKLMGDMMNKYVNDNWREFLDDVGEASFEGIGLSIHNIFSEAATTLPYSDVFYDTE